MTKNQDIGPEFSRVIEIEGATDTPSLFPLEANATERAALARRFGLPSIEMLKAQIRLQRIHGGTALRLTGRIEAELTQTCVVSLEPVQNRVEDEFTILFAADAPADAIDEDPEREETWAEPLPSEGLDIGEVVAQHLFLALDPYPRRADAAVEGRWAEPPDPAADSPFSALAKLKAKPS
jgi:uncharacterized metal-binding protein YceD (DUF177 family)